jgi:hypothetical protein
MRTAHERVMSARGVAHSLVCAGPRFPATVRAGLTDAARAGLGAKLAGVRSVSAWQQWQRSRFARDRTGSGASERIPANWSFRRSGATGRERSLIAPRRSPVRVRLAPSKTLEISAIPEGAGGLPGQGRLVKLWSSTSTFTRLATDARVGSRVLRSPSSTDPPAPSGVFLERRCGRGRFREDVGEAAVGHGGADVGGVARPIEEVGVDVEGDRRACVAEDAADLADVEAQVEYQVAGEGGGGRGSEAAVGRVRRGWHA